ncbi:MAG: DUF4838 domain-containing protein [Clostridia bacterium]|nr:DUF4838 domain-containing protein [Clostridia bacterium]
MKINVLNADSTTFFAAEELKKYLRMMMPRRSEASVQFDPEAKSGFRIGLMQTIGLDVSDAEDAALDDIVYIDANDDGGVIAGSNPIATLIAVYRFLRECGCRWLFPGVDGERIPVIEKLPEVKLRKKADHRYRGQCNEGAEFQQDLLETIDFTPKIGMNTYMIEFDIPEYYYRSYYDHKDSDCRKKETVSPQTVLQWKRQCEAEIKKRGLHLHDMGHGWTAEPFGISSTNGWTKTEDENAAIPEGSRQYLAELNGVRGLHNGVALNTNVCLSNPETRKIMANYISDYAQTENCVDFLHVWLADAAHNYCECPNCRRKTPTDWYLTLMNDIDAEMTKRGLDTHVVFLAYVDLFWPPETAKILNPKRFTLLFAPITRLYTESYLFDADTEGVTKYELNKSEFPKGMSVGLGFLKKWKEVWKGDVFCYEYHFCNVQYLDPGNLKIAKRIWEDVQGLKKHGLMGIVEDGSQRSYFPTGLNFYVYGETLFDSSRSFEELRDDYFSHAFGDKWRTALNFLEKICDLEEYEKLYFILSKLRHPDEEYLKKLKAEGFGKKLEEAARIAEEFEKTAEENRICTVRCETASWTVLQESLRYIRDTALMCAKLVDLDFEGAAKIWDECRKHYSEREVYIERNFDIWNLFHRIRFTK